jgi:hypothetical protein
MPKKYKKTFLILILIFFASMPFLTIVNTIGKEDNYNEQLTLAGMYPILNYR